MIVEKKRGLSPVIATVLLVSIALVLAVIIFLWARSFIAETVLKGGERVELMCEDVGFLAEAYGEQLLIENIATVPIYGVEIRVLGSGEIREVAPTTGGTIEAGQTMSFDLPVGISSGETIIAVPILLGETDEEQVPYICDIDYGVEAVVG
ncbi:MAG: hypothetical protein KJ600_04585 [Nanoarchaeota archaeon]|nr:hypothetical protein [Nanoarchaeota archaeon]MBU1103805.1 hypothetical protein [Nanoarchaeota archaeon]